jgi:membrane protein YqaA with SNARE-associated domain
MQLLHTILDWFQELFASMGLLGLIIVSFTESSFFLIPPDTFLIPMALANPDSAIAYAAYVTIFSVLGAMFGYWLGVKLGRPFLHKFASAKTIHKAERLFEKYGIAAVIISGFTPIPFKVFTILSGIVRFSFSRFIIGCLIGRGVRFMAEGFIIFYFKDEAVALMNKYGTNSMIGLGILLIAGFLIYSYFSKKKEGN